MKSAIATRVIETVDELTVWRKSASAPINKAEVVTIGLVPTMGALHGGHVSLIDAAVRQCDLVVVSIFVNPLQFGQGEDLKRYPRPFSKDLEFCRKSGVDVVFHPSLDEMYGHGQGQLTTVLPPETLIDQLCGAFRPGHFQGVATVVVKLFGQVQPHRAYFGEKDYQQLIVITRMVKDLFLPVEIISCPTVRESSGLAMSSRNAYLTADEHKKALVLHAVLCHVRDQVVSGRVALADALASGREMIHSCPGVTLQYLEARDPEELRPIENASGSMVILVAATIGAVRLIDNLIIRPD